MSRHEGSGDGQSQVDHEAEDRLLNRVLGAMVVVGLVVWFVAELCY